MRNIVTTSAAATVMLAGTLAGAASAAPAPEQKAETHCIQPVGAAGSKAVEPSCFPTYAEVVRSLTKGAITLPRDAKAYDSTLSQDAALEKAAAAAATYILSTEYKDSRFRGDSISYTGPTDCNNGSYGGNLASGWNNTIGSSKAYSSCWAVHFDNAGATTTTSPPGSSISVTDNISFGQLGAMNDATTSMRWF